MSERSEARDLRDIADRIERLARDHPAWSMIHKPVQVLVDYLFCMACNIDYRENEKGEVK